LNFSFSSSSSNSLFFFLNDSSGDSDGDSSILVWFYCEWELFPLTKWEGDKIRILSTEDDDTTSGIVVDDDDNDDEIFRLFLIGVIGNELAVGLCWARYFDGWNEWIGKRTGQEDFIQRLFVNWKLFMWKI